MGWIFHLDKKSNGGGTGEESSRKLPLAHSSSLARNLEQNGVAKFPKLEDCAHFHYDAVDIGTLQISLYEGFVTLDNRQHLTRQPFDIQSNPSHVHLQVKTGRDSAPWIIERSIDSLCRLDRQLHQCVFDRKYSLLPELRNSLLTTNGQVDMTQRDALHHTMCIYFQRLSAISGNMVNCGAILNWLEMDNRGNRIIVASDRDSAINIPAVGAALVKRRYTAQVPDEISLEVGEIISLIDMPPLHECNWWRGKRQFEVGFFPADCVEVIAGKVPETVVTKVSPTPVKPVLRKRGKLIVRLRAFFSSRPARNQLKQSGIVKERVFGCDLGELLLNSGHDVPLVLKFCTEVIETYGIVDGVYRLSGIASNIQKLRNEFDENRVPALTEDIYIRDIHSISSLLKMYFRELPNPLLTYQLYEKFVAAMQDEDNRLIMIHNVIQQLPPPHYRTCAFLMKHLNRMASFGKKTCMTGRNLAIVWAPNLLRCKELEQMQCNMTALKSVGTQAVITEFLINYADLLFGDGLVTTLVGRRNGSGRRQLRPKSLAVSTPTKLLSLEEARQRALVTAKEPSAQVFLDVGGGPAALPPVYHTIIDLPKRKQGGFYKKGSSATSSKWKDLLNNRPNTSSRGSKSSLTEEISVLSTSQASLSFRGTTEVEIVRESVMPTGSSQVEFAVNGRPKVVLRKRDGHATSHSFHLSGPCSSSSTPPIDSYSLNDITADHSSNQRPSSFSASSIYTRALSDDIQRPDSIGFDLATAACDVSAPRKSVSFSRSTYSSVSGSGTPRAPIASTAVPEESLSSSSSSTGSPSSDDVFMSVAGSRECSTSPFERQSKVTRVAPRVVKSPDSTTCVEPTRSSSSTVDRADGSRSVETRSDVFYSAAGSDSDSEPLGGSRQALSNPNHCISDLCSDDESEDVTDHISSNHGVASRRFQSPVCNHSSQSARHIDDTGLGSERCVKLPDERAKQDACTVDLDDSAADGLSSSAAVVHEVDSIKSSVLGDDNIDTANVNTNGAGVASDNSTDVIVSNDNVRTASPLAVVERPADESSRDSMVTKEHVMTGQSVQRDAISENAELVDERQKSSSDGCQGQAAGESDGCGGNDSHCEDWLFIDDTDDDICADVSATRSLRRIAEEARSSPTMTRSSANNTTTSDVSFESPFHSPPTSPTLMDAITDVWLRGIGTRDERKYAQDLMNESFANDTDQSDLTTLESRQQQQQDGMVVDRAGTRVPSLSAGSAGVDENPLSSGMAAASDGTIVAETLNRSNNAVADALQTRQSPVDVMSAPVDASAAAAFEKSTQTESRLRRTQSTPSNATVSGDDDIVFDSPVESVSTVPDVIRDAESSYLANSAVASSRKKSVKELKTKFEQNASKETVAASVGTVFSSKTPPPPPQYARSQSYHGFHATDPDSRSCTTDDLISGSSKLGKSVGVLTVDVVPHAAEARNVVFRRPEAATVVRRREKAPPSDNNVDDDAGSSGTGGSRSASRSIDDELQFVSQQYSLPSVSARISCFEPLLSTARKSPEFHTTPENKRARLSSCGSSVGGSYADGQNSVTLDDGAPAADQPDAMYSSDADRVKVNAELGSRYKSPLFGCDLLTLLDIPAATAKALPRVSERKRIFEAEPTKLANSSGRHGSQKNCSIIETSEDQKVASWPLTKSDKENSCNDLVAPTASSRRKLFSDSERVADPVCSPESSDPAAVKSKLSEVKMNGGGGCSSGKTEFCQQ